MSTHQESVESWLIKTNVSPAVRERVLAEQFDSLHELAVLTERELEEQLGVTRLADKAKFRVLRQRVSIDENSSGDRRHVDRVNSPSPRPPAVSVVAVVSDGDFHNSTSSSDSSSSELILTSKQSRRIPSVTESDVSGHSEDQSNTNASSSPSSSLPNVSDSDRASLNGSDSDPASSSSDEGAASELSSVDDSDSSSESTGESESSSDSARTKARIDYMTALRKTVSEDLVETPAHFRDRILATLTSFRSAQVEILDALDLRELGTDRRARSRDLTRRLRANSITFGRMKFEALKVLAQDWLHRLGELREVYGDEMKLIEPHTLGRSCGFRIHDVDTCRDASRLATLLDLVNFKPFVSAHIEAMHRSAGQGLEQSSTRVVVNRVPLSHALADDPEFAPTFSQTVTRFLRAVRDNATETPVLVIEKRIREDDVQQLKDELEGFVKLNVKHPATKVLGADRVHALLLTGDPMFGGNEVQLIGRASTNSLVTSVLTAFSCCSTQKVKFKTWISWRFDKSASQVVSDHEDELRDLCMMPYVRTWYV